MQHSAQRDTFQQALRDAVATLDARDTAWELTNSLLWDATPFQLRQIYDHHTLGGAT